MNEAHENGLIERSRRGDAAAYTELVRRYQDVVYRCTYRVLGHPEDAADATQAAFIKLYERLDSFDTRRRFFSWMYRLAINEAIDMKRRMKAHEPMPAAGLMDQGAGPQQKLEAVLLRGKVQRALGRLGNDGRVVLVLRHYGELSYREISEILEVPEKTVRSRLYSARQQLKKELMEDSDT